MNNKLIIIGLVICIFIGIFLHFYKINQIPPCLNADEAAFGYNAYSILKTGRDEYGAFLPLRLKSFDDFKLPIYTYLSIPFVALFGLNEFSTRFLNILIGVAFIPTMYFLTKELFNNKKTALIAAFLTSINPGIYILSRQAQEGVIGAFFVLLSFLFLIKFLKTNQFKSFLMANLFILLNAFSYQSGRVYLVFFFLLQLFYLFSLKELRKHVPLKILVITFVLFFSLFFDFKYGLNRVNNLFFFKSSGFQSRLIEYLGEDPNRLLHNKATEAIREVTNRYIQQISPEFLVLNGDTNWRFGFPNLGLFTPIEYIFIFVGIYYLFKKKLEFRFLLLFLIAITPINNALTWQDASLIRSYIIIFPLIILISLGVYNLFVVYKENKYFYVFVFIVLALFSFYKYNHWDLYFNHYPKRAIVIRAWQCGYKELVSYVKDNYNKYDKFYITDKNGQPYIFFLFYWPFDPKTYQAQAKISAPDEFGFGQIGKFDKFIFSFRDDKYLKNSVFIGYPDNFNNYKPDDLSKIKKIKIGTEEIFWIYENK